MITANPSRLARIRTIMSVLSASAASILGWQLTAFAQCATGNGCPTPSGCTVTISPGYSCCSTDGLDCCQYLCKTYTYSGTNCPGSCVWRSFSGVHIDSSCGGNGVCS
jgi:hypothetical protein